VFAGSHASPADFELLKRDEHDNVPTADTEEVRSEALVECEWALILQHPPDHRKWIGWLSGYLVHDTRLEHVDRRSHHNSVEACSKRASNVQ